MQRYCLKTKFSLLLCNDTFTNHSHSEKQHQHHTRWQLHLIMTVNAEDYQELYEKIQAKYVKATKRIIELEKEVGSLYEDMESMEHGFGTYTGKKKRNAFDAANEPLIGEVLDQVFRRYKFLPLSKLLGFTPEDPRSVCGRIKKVVVLGGRKFTKTLNRGRIVRIAVNKIVTLRSRFGKAVMGGYRGECMHAELARNID